ncbi:Na+/H+ antiporter NhaA [Novosphingobium sp. KACC 22771]|uniref:Na+/H+ antiporter NhaA n=1 Tax=Novosphingobium sp. KACC 22771 TaxID=3025670 RepID=UPI0023668AE5|nr:Na+/H+ antiporter NhaA [Novosphingobium sp. KACC 22771]WDF73770.1 Na+/H+ antiporter NhaA [Novosphingobium sp. KACC 22771]
MLFFTKSRDFVQNLARNQEILAGILLAFATIVAIAISNSPLSPAWTRTLDQPLFTPRLPHLASLRDVMGNGVMVAFFFTVGLEVKREVLIGNLADARQRRLPVLAALAGMAVPAAIYLMMVRDAPALQRGWAIPSATDIAFAMGVIALLGRCVPRSLRLFLLTVAVVDDIGAVIVIALGYTAHVDAAWLGAGAAVLAAGVALNRIGCKRVWPYGLMAVALWWCVLHSGVHATVAGVLAALTVPIALDERHDSPLLRLEHALAPWSGLVIVPLFGLVNAGVRLGGPVGDLTLPLAIGAGLALGKPLGIMGAMWLAEITGFARRPEGLTWLQALGAGQLAGIGFTMSMFISTLAFTPDPARENAIRMGILAGSLISGSVGALILRLGHNKSGRSA